MLAIIGPAVIAVALVLVATAQGIGVTPDAAVYLEAARHLAAGDGFVAAVPCTGALAGVTHFPPLYPWLLSLGVRAGLSPTDAARFLAAALAGATSALVAAVVLGRARRRAPAALAGLLFATSLGMLEAHTAAWSEPLALFLGLAGLSLTVASLERPAPRTLLAAAAVLALAALTRYVGATLVAAAALAQLLLGPGSRWRRLGRAAVTAGVGAAPLAALMLSNLLRHGSAADRGAGMFVPIGLAHLRSILLVAGSWLLPGVDRVPALAPAEPVAVGLGVLVVAAVALVPRGRDATVAVHRIFMAVYLALFLVSVAFIDHESPFDQRNFAPLFLSTLIVLVCGLSGPGRLPRARRAAAALLALASAAAAVAAARELHARGRGYLGRDWRFEQTLAAIAALPADTRVITNLPVAVHFLTGRAACAYDEPVAGDAVVAYFPDTRRFKPRVAGGVRDLVAPRETARGLAHARGLGRETREREALLFTR